MDVEVTRLFCLLLLTACERESVPVPVADPALLFTAHLEAKAEQQAALDAAMQGLSAPGITGPEKEKLLARTEAAAAATARTREAFRSGAPEQWRAYCPSGFPAPGDDAEKGFVMAACAATTEAGYEKAEAGIATARAARRSR